jgi:hypothetical protein
LLFALKYLENFFSAFFNFRLRNLARCVVVVVGLAERGVLTVAVQAGC